MNGNRPRQGLHWAVVAAWAALSLLPAAGRAEDGFEFDFGLDGAVFDEPAAPPPPQIDNPGELIEGIFDVFRNLIQGRQAADGAREEPERVPEPPANGNLAARDRIDGLLPYDGRLSQGLRRAEDQINSGNFQNAIRILAGEDGVLDQPHDSLVRRPDGQWTSVRAEANRLLGRLPKEGLDLYRLQYGAMARHSLQDALAQRDLSLLEETALRYFHTEAGQQAADHAATLYIDRGEYGLAVRWFARLVEADSPVTRDPKWRLKAAFALRRSGSEFDAEAWFREAGNRIAVGGAEVDPLEWLAEAGGPAAPRQPVLKDWPLLYGTPSRRGTAAGGEPLLLPRWSQPLTVSLPLQEQLALLLEDLEDQRRAPVPATFPLMVEGKAVFRTLRGVQVVDAESGRPLWETNVRPGTTPEDLLQGRTQPNAAQDPFMRFRGGMGMPGGMAYSGGQADRHPLASLLFRDGTHGLLSSDGRRLFVLEDHAILSPQQGNYGWGMRFAQNDPLRRDWSSNRIVAYDLESGGWQWEVGGPETSEPFGLPLAGNYFFGVPVPDGDELFAVAEENAEIRLVALDRNSGTLRWTQQIAFSDPKIEMDPLRRHWPAQVAVGEGMLICPTTVGWLVGIDRAQRSIAWVYRYSQPGTADDETVRGGRIQRFQTSEPDPLNSRWTPSAPIIAGNHVVYTPAEEPVLVCLNTFDGSLVWKRAKEKFLYVAGVFGERVILVGQTEIAALALKTGEMLWQLKIPGDAGLPSGFGVAVGDRYHLPLTSGQLWSIDLADGTVAARSYLSDGQPPLGNLGMYRGMLLSLSPTGLTSFEQREAIESEIRRRKEQDARDAWALLREAEIHLLHREHAAALTLLRQVRSAEVAADLRDRYRQALVESLVAVVRTDLAAHDREMDELAAAVETDDERFAFRQLQAERLHARGELKAAFARYHELADEDPGRMLSAGERVTVRLDCWLAGKLFDLWSSMPAELRREVDGELAEAAEQVLTAGDADARERFMRLYQLHPAARQVREAIAAEHADAGRLVQAEALLMTLIREGGPAAQERLAKLQAEAVPRDEQRSPPTWGDADVRLVSSGTNYSDTRTHDLSVAGNRLPFFQDHRFLLHQQQRLTIVRADDDALHWTLPLRINARALQGPAAEVVTSGHRMFVAQRGVLHALSPADRKVLWTRLLDTRGGTVPQGYNPFRQQGVRPMDNGVATLAHKFPNGQLPPRAEQLAVANADYVCVYGRREFTVLDADTGAVRWTRPLDTPQTRVYGNEDFLLVVPENRNRATMLRAIDGKPLDLPNAGDLAFGAVHFSPGGVTLVERGDGENRSRTAVVRLFDPLTRTERWRVECPQDARSSLLDDGRLLLVHRSGAIDLLDLETGEMQGFENTNEAGQRSNAEWYALADRDHLYLVTNRSGGRGVSYSQEVPSLPVNGQVAVFDRETGRRLWSEDVSRQNLVVQNLAHSPVLAFLNRTAERRGNTHHTAVQILALDKRTGRRLIETTSLLNDSFHSFDVSTSQRFVELTGHSRRLRLMAVERKTDSEE